jgi:hypothetical protein
MTMTNDKIKQLVGRNISGLDIIHGELKNLMYEVEQDLENALPAQSNVSFLKGKLESYAELYELTYDIYFQGGK